jgi:hypothetical protein
MSMMVTSQEKYRRYRFQTHRLTLEFRRANRLKPHNQPEATQCKVYATRTGADIGPWSNAREPSEAARSTWSAAIQVS